MFKAGTFTVSYRAGKMCIRDRGWIDNENMPVCDYLDFAQAVLRIPGAHEMVTKYTILDNDKKKLLILRPYQILSLIHI